MATTCLSLTSALPGGPRAASVHGYSPGMVMEFREPQDTSVRVTHSVLSDSFIPRRVCHSSPLPGGSWGLRVREGKKGNRPGVMTVSSCWCLCAGIPGAEICSPVMPVAIFHVCSPLTVAFPITLSWHVCAPGTLTDTCPSPLSPLPLQVPWSRQQQ
ncbi:unnamed protein product [Coccothraustes coccothraustes]